MQLMDYLIDICMIGMFATCAFHGGAMHVLKLSIHATSILVQAAWPLPQGCLSTNTKQILPRACHAYKLTLASSCRAAHSSCMRSSSSNMSCSCCSALLLCAVSCFDTTHWTATIIQHDLTFTPGATPLPDYPQHRSLVLLMQLEHHLP